MFGKAADPVWGRGTSGLSQTQGKDRSALQAERQLGSAQPDPERPQTLSRERQGLGTAGPPRALSAKSGPIFAPFRHSRMTPYLWTDPSSTTAMAVRASGLSQQRRKVSREAAKNGWS